MAWLGYLTLLVVIGEGAWACVAKVDDPLPWLSLLATLAAAIIIVSPNDEGEK
jgi:hypothetical protein